MRKTRNATLNLLSLESKITPAVTANVSGGNLSVFGDNSSNTIFLFSHAANIVDVYAVPGYVADAGGNALTYEVPSNKVGTFVLGPTGRITVHTGNFDDSVVLTQDDGTTLPGNFTASVARGNDDIQIQTRTNGPATIAGAVSLFGGEGADNFFVFDTVVEGRTSVNGGTSGVRPGVFPLPGDVFEPSNSTFNDDIIVSNAVVLIDSGYGPNTINGNLRVTNSTAGLLGNYRLLDTSVYPAGATAADPGTYSGLVVLDTDTVINGDFYFVGSASPDGIYINGEITGRASITAGAGDNQFFLGDRGGVGVIGGDFNVTGTKGIDSIHMADGSSVGGKVNINVGDGVNVYDLDNTFTVGGDFRLTAGKDTDNVGNLGGTIGKNVFVNLGNGSNNINFTFAGLTSNINYTGGTGVDDVELGGSHASFRGTFGSGNDTFAYQVGASLSNFFIGNGGAGTDTYDGSAVVETWKVSTTAFEVIL